MSLPMAGPAIKDWQNNHVIRPRAKMLCTSMIGISLLVIWLYVDVSIWIKSFITLLLVSVTIFVVSRKSA
jgi:uncharacterized membrane protein YbaN (DUF454 family)